MQHAPVASQTVLPPHAQVQAVPAALQWGALPLHAVAQQMPAPLAFATQWPCRHCADEPGEHEAPSGFAAVQVPPLVAWSHQRFGPQSASLLHGPQAVALAQ